jgi:hypothetical protein
MRFLVIIAFFGCKGKADSEAARACEGTCPPGTYYDEYRAERSSTTPHEDFEAGKCKYSCVASAPCPEGYWPVITEECFTCAVEVPSGDVASAVCDEGSWWDDRDDAPDGELSTEERGGDVPIEPAFDVSFTGVEFLGSVALDFEPNGMAYDGELLWMADWADQSLKGVDPQNGVVIKTVSVGAINPSALCATGSDIWVIEDSTITRLSTETGDFSTVLSGQSCTASEGFLVIPAGHQVGHYNIETGALDHMSYREGFQADTDIVLATWFDQHLIQIRSERLDVSSIALFAWDVSEWTNHPLVGDFSFDLDLYPANGLTMIGDRIYLTGKHDGSLANKIVFLQLK